MANKFILWCEDENATQDYNTFVNDSQRQSGFQGGQPASAIRVNTALRQANLVSAALMNALLPDNQTLNYRNDIPTVANAINTALTSKIQTTKVNNASNADNATNVTTNINGKAISSIFESDGTIVKNATNASYSSTQAQSDNSTKIATTAYVRTAIENVKNIIYGDISISIASTSITVKQVKRQVNFVIGELTFEDSNATRYTSGTIVIGNIPENFRPKTTYNCYCIASDWVASGALRPYTCTINTNGNISVTSGTSAVRAYSYSVKFAYEIT